MNEETATKPQRLVSIDALRGFDMFWIIGGTWIFESLAEWMNPDWLPYVDYHFSHSDWDGCRFYDIIFPLFIFITGASLPFAVAARRAKGATNGALQIHAIRRALTLVLFGLIVNGLFRFDFESFRYAGVLQRIGLSYGFAAIIALNSEIRGKVIWLVGILLGYWAMMAWIPVPGIGAGVLTPEGNLASYIDRLLLPGRFCCFEFGDNEGLLSTLPAVGTALMGILAGEWLKSSATPWRKAGGLAVAGLVSLAVGWVWGLAFPINKLLWSSSYVVFVGGWSLLALAFFYTIIDVLGFKKWSFFFVVIGMNAITIYFGQRFIDFGHTAEFFFGGLQGALGSFRDSLEAISVMAMKWGFLYYLFKKKIFLKV